MEHDEEGTVALGIEPLIAIAGGVMGGALTLGALWTATWALLGRRTRAQARQRSRR